MVRFTITGARQFYHSLNDGRTWVQITATEADELIEAGAPLIYS